MKTKHPQLRPTLFRCQTCGTEHHIASTLGGERAVEVCAVCSTPGQEHVVGRGARIDRFRLRQAKARARG